MVEFSKRDIAELYELREALEVYAVGVAAEHMVRPADAGTLRDLVGEILVLRDELEKSGRQCLTGDQMRQFVRIDMNFHALLVRAAANRRILKVFADTRVLLNVFTMRRKGHDAALLTEIHDYHSNVLEAVLRRDGEEAMRLPGEHIRVSKQERLKEYDEWEREAAMAHTLPGLADVGAPESERSQVEL